MSRTDKHMGKYKCVVAWVWKYSYNIQNFIIQLVIERRFVVEAGTTACDLDEAQMGFFIHDRKLRDAHASPTTSLSHFPFSFYSFLSSHCLTNCYNLPPSPLSTLVWEAQSQIHSAEIKLCGTSQIALLYSNHTPAHKYRQSHTHTLQISGWRVEKM